MRRIAETLSVALFAEIILVAASALYGPYRLPVLIPTHFNAAGQPDGWGSPRALLLFPAIAAILYLLMSWVARHPASFNFPVRATPRNRKQLEAIALSMIAWIKAEVVGILAWVEWSSIRAAGDPHQQFSRLPMPVLIGLVFATVLGHIGTMFRVARAPARL